MLPGQYWCSPLQPRCTHTLPSVAPGGAGSPAPQLGQLYINRAVPAALVPGTFLPCMIAILKNHGLEMGSGSVPAAVKCCHIARGTAGSAPSQPLPGGSQPCAPGQPPQSWGDRVPQTGAPWRPWLQDMCILLHPEQAPRMEISTSIYQNQPSQLPSTKATSSKPLIKAGQRAPGPAARRRAQPARMGLARRVTSSSPSAAHVVQEDRAAGQFSPSIPSLLHPNGRCLSPCNCSPQLHCCGSWVQLTPVLEPSRGMVWGALGCCQPCQHHTGGGSCCSSCIPASSWKSPLQPCRSPVVYSQPSPASHPAQRVDY